MLGLLAAAAAGGGSSHADTDSSSSSSDQLHYELSQRKNRGDERQAAGLPRDSGDSF